jgi:hypothetical protein
LQSNASSEFFASIKPPIFGLRLTYSRYGQYLVKRCNNYRKAEEGAQELLVSIEYNWAKTEVKIQFLKALAPNLDATYLALQSHILSYLEGKLKDATLTINQLIETKKRIEGHDEKDLVARIKSLTAMGPGKKTRYAFRREALEAIVADLEKWQERFDPTWMLMMRMEYRAIDEMLTAESQKPRSDQSSFIMNAKAMRDTARLSMEQVLPAQQKVWLDANSFNPVDLNSTSPTLLSITHLKDSGDQVMVDTVHCNPIADITRTTKEVCNLARVLSKVDPMTFGLLKCRGIIKGSEITRDRLGSPKELPTFTFVFDISPELSNPRSLRSILQKATPYALNERFELARQLTHSILYVHTARFVHKNIRPETIVVFENEKSKIGASFLLGFEKFRHEDGQTYGAGDGLWEQNLCMSSILKQLPSNHCVRFRHPMSRSGNISDLDFDS